MVTKSKCQAKDPAKCRYHTTRYNALAQPQPSKSLYDHYLATKDTAAGFTLPKNISSIAADSSLNYEGTQPKWWKGYQEKAAADEKLPAKAELIDVIDSPAGKLAVVWQNESHQKGDRGLTMDSGIGINVCYYKSFETGETLGYVKMAYMDDRTVKMSFGDDEFTPFRWEDRYSGSSYGFRYSPEMKTSKDRVISKEEAIELRRKVWVAAIKASDMGIKTADGKYVASYNINESHLPDDKTVAKDLKKYAKEMQKTIDIKREYYKTPYVDYSQVNDKLKGKGFGAALYVYTARKLGEQGKVLRGSGIQSDDAQSLWGKFAKRFPNNVSNIELESRSGKTISPILDFRK
jgi:hypothetical protein